jgi:hypothetical protein
MGRVLRRGTTTTEAVRRAIRHSQESLRTLVRRYGIKPRRWPIKHGWDAKLSARRQSNIWNDRFSLSSHLRLHANQCLTLCDSLAGLPLFGRLLDSPGPPTPAT